MRIRLAQQGEVGPGGGPAGDLYVEIHERPHDVFSRKGDDLHCRVTVPMTAAALGTRLTIKTLDSEETVDVKAGHPARRARCGMRARGVPHLRGTGRGDLLRAPRRADPDQARRRAGADAARLRPDPGRGGRRAVASRAASSPGCATPSTATPEPCQRAAVPGRVRCPTGDALTLDGPEGHHAATVQRLRVGEELLLADGRGGTAAAVVTAVGRGSLELDGHLAGGTSTRADPPAGRGAGHRQGRPGRAGRAGDDRGRGGRDRALGGVPLGGAVARRPGRTGPARSGRRPPGRRPSRPAGPGCRWWPGAGRVHRDGGPPVAGAAPRSCCTRRPTSG